MTAIHPMIYIGLGVIVSAVSLISNMQSGTNKMALFLLAGVIFIIIGGIKLAIPTPKKSVAPPVAPRHHPGHPLHRQHHAYQEMTRHRGHDTPLQPHKPAVQHMPSGVEIRYCNFCGAKVYSTAKFCHVCGNQVSRT